MPSKKIGPVQKSAPGLKYKIVHSSYNRCAECLKNIQISKLSLCDIKSKHMRAVAYDFQQCGIFTSEDLDEHVQPPFKLRTSKRFAVGSLTLIEYSSDEQRL